MVMSSPPLLVAVKAKTGSVRGSVKFTVMGWFAIGEPVVILPASPMPINIYNQDEPV
jgi:hypothetical protein